MSRPLRVAVVGAGPAGIYASDLLVKSGEDVTVDLFERMPAPFGLIRYGVAPDHPRIKGIVKSLHAVLEKPEIRLLGNIEVGKDITVDEMREYYDAVVFSTGATGDCGSRDRSWRAPTAPANSSASTTATLTSPAIGTSPPRRSA